MLLMKSPINKDDAQQINGREGETAMLLSRCVVSFGLRVIGFAPRQILCWKSNGFRPIRVKRFAGFQDSVS